MMKLAIDPWLVIKNYGEEKAFEMIRKAGFDAVDYPLFRTNPDDNILGDDYLERAANTKRLLDKYDLVCNQTHAAFGNSKFNSPMDTTHREYRSIVLGMEYSAILGAQHVVVHGVPCPMGIDIVAQTVKYYQSLEPYAKQFGVKIAVENMIPSSMLNTIDLFNATLEQLDPEWFVALFDVGHAFLNHIAPETFIRKILPGRLQGLHVHDNSGVVDTHTAPYLGKIQWDYVLEALAEVRYPGDFTFESAGGLLTPFHPRYYPEALAFNAAIGWRMVEQLQSMMG